MYRCTLRNRVSSLSFTLNISLDTWDIRIKPPNCHSVSIRVPTRIKRNLISLRYFKISYAGIDSFSSSQFLPFDTDTVHVYICTIIRPVLSIPKSSFTLVNGQIIFWMLLIDELCRLLLASFSSWPIQYSKWIRQNRIFKEPDRRTVIGGTGIRFVMLTWLDFNLLTHFQLKKKERWQTMRGMDVYVTSENCMERKSHRVSDKLMMTMTVSVSKRPNRARRRQPVNVRTRRADWLVWPFWPSMAWWGPERDDTPVDDARPSQSLTAADWVRPTRVFRPVPSGFQLISLICEVDKENSDRVWTTK